MIRFQCRDRGMAVCAWVVLALLVPPARGVSERSEFLGLTDPTDPGQGFDIAGTVHVGTGADLTLPTVYGVTYFVETSGSLTNDWTVWTNIVGTGAGVIVTNVPGGYSNAYLRVRAVR